MLTLNTNIGTASGQICLKKHTFPKTNPKLKWKRKYYKKLPSFMTYIEDITQRREDTNFIHIFRPPCNFLFIIWTRVFLHKQQCKSER